MAWQDEMGELLRVMVQDLGDPPVNSDDSVQRLLVASSQIVANTLDFSQAFAADIPNRDIVPDPTDSDGGTRDDSFINLVCMKAASLIEQGSVRSQSGIVIRDNGSMVDLRSQLAAALELVKNGWAKAYEEAKLQYQVSSLHNKIAGQAVIGPFRAVASGFFGWGEESDANYPAREGGYAWGDGWGGGYGFF